jgi:hypothetical protein
MFGPLDHAKLLLSTLHPQPSAAALIEITALRAKRKGYLPTQRYFTDAQIAAEWALELNTQRYSIFVGVNPRHAMGSFETDVAASTALFLDLQPERTNLDEVFASLTRHGVPPSISVCSGNGAHLYLLLNPIDPALAKPVARRLCGALSSDAVFNTNRIARIPGSINWKPPPKQPTWCYLTGVWPERRYDIAQVDAALDAMGAPSVRRPPTGTPIQPIDEATWIDVRRQLSPHALAIIDFGEKNPYSEKQVTRSEADWLAICSLVRAGATDELIHWVYETQPIGDLKYREAGLRYLNHTIEAARRATVERNKEAAHQRRPPDKPRPPRGSVGDRRVA